MEAVSTKTLLIFAFLFSVGLHGMDYEDHEHRPLLQQHFHPTLEPLEKQGSISLTVTDVTGKLSIKRAYPELTTKIKFISQNCEAELDGDKLYRYIRYLDAIDLNKQPPKSRSTRPLLRQISYTLILSYIAGILTKCFFDRWLRKA